MGGKGKAMKGAKKGGGRGEAGRREVRSLGITNSMVEVIFVEELMRWYKIVSSPDETIPASFLEDVFADSYEFWKRVQVGDLVARAIPRLLAEGSTFCDWNGVILVELKQAKLHLGIINQWKMSTIETLSAQMKLKMSMQPKVLVGDVDEVKTLKLKVDALSHDNLWLWVISIYLIG